MAELQAFGRDVCGVYNPAAVVASVQAGMRQALVLAQRNNAVPPKVRLAVAQAWSESI